MSGLIYEKEIGVLPQSLFFCRAKTRFEIGCETYNAKALLTVGSETDF